LTPERFAKDIQKVGDRGVIDIYASRQYGVFNRRQIREAGYDRSAVQRRVGSGEWVRLCPNVFCVASAPPKWERQLAAAVLSRPRALVGGTSAAHLLSLRGFRRGRPTIIVPEGANTRLSIGRVIRSKHFDSLSTESVAGFEVTSTAETLMTLARDLSVSDLETALEDALLTGRVDIEKLRAVLAREVGSPWAGVMDRLVVDHSADAPTPNSSYLEALLERLLAEAELPTTLREFSFSIRGTPARVDVYIPDWQMVIEADGRAWHGRLRDQEADRRRDAGLAARGIQAIRLTYRMITDDPGECLSMILAAGAHRSASRVG
jgi:very-short-patch-repair endonuclease